MKLFTLMNAHRRALPLLAATASSWMAEAFAPIRLATVRKNTVDASATPTPSAKDEDPYTRFIPFGGDPFQAMKKVESVIDKDYNGRGPFKFAMRRNKRLEEALAGISTHFCYEGTEASYYGPYFQKPWEALLQNSVGSLLSDQELSDAKDILAQGKLPVSALVKIASPAPFGRGGETVFDKNVRNALEIPSDCMPEELVHELTRLVIDKYIRPYQLENEMKPYGKVWTYKLYNIHMYGPGGKFDKHVDTLHGENHVATLVVCLPSLHKGGALHVQHMDKNVSIQFTGRGKGRYGMGCECAAFFTDCTHEVEEVTEGWRVVAQFDIYERDQTQEEIEEDDEDNDYDDENLLKRAVKSMGRQGVLAPPKTVRSDSSFQQVANAVEAMLLSRRNQGAAVGFFLRHRYSLPSLEGNKLKGADRVVFDLMEAKGYQVFVTAVIARFDYDDNSGKVYAICMDDFDLSSTSSGSSDDDVESKSSAVDEDAERNKAIIKVDLVVDEKMAKAELIREEEPIKFDYYDIREGYLVGYLVYRSACMIIVEKDGNGPDSKGKESEDDRKQAAKPVPALPRSATDRDSKPSASGAAADPGDEPSQAEEEQPAKKLKMDAAAEEV